MSDHEGDLESGDEDSEGFELNGSDSDYNEAEDGPGISNGRTVRRSSSRPADSVSGLSQYLNQVREDLEAREQGGASPQLLAPVLLDYAEDDHDTNNNTSQQSVNVTPLSSPNPVVQAPAPLT